MGNQNANGKGLNYRKKFESDVQYELYNKRDDSDIFNCELALYKNRENKHLIACIDKTNQTNYFEKGQLQVLEERIKCDNPNLIKLIGYFSDTERESICGNTYRQCYYVEYPIGSLKDEIDLRKYMNKPFSELDLWGFLRGIVNGLTELKKQDLKCRNISSTTIYIDYDGYYQISEQYLVKETSIFDEIQLRIFAKDMYISPQQLEILKNGTLIDTSNIFLSDIFSLGVLLIEMIYLEDQSDLFTYDQELEEINIDLERLKERLQYREKLYSKILVRLVLLMIQHDEKDRITLEELSEELEKHYRRVFQVEFGKEQLEACNEQRKTDFVEYILNKDQYDYKKSTKAQNSSNAVLRDMRRALANKLQRYNQKPDQDSETIIIGDKVEETNPLGVEVVAPAEEKSKPANIFSKIQKQLPKIQLSNFLTKMQQGKDLYESHEGEEPDRAQEDHYVMNEPGDKGNGSKRLLDYSKNKGRNSSLDKEVTVNTMDEQIMNSIERKRNSNWNFNFDQRRTLNSEQKNGNSYFDRRLNPLKMQMIDNKRSIQSRIHFDSERCLNSRKYSSAVTSPSHKITQFAYENRQSIAQRGYQQRGNAGDIFYEKFNSQAPSLSKIEYSNHYWKSTTPGERETEMVISKHRNISQQESVQVHQQDDDHRQQHMSPKRLSPDRYEQRINKYNVCSDKYQKVNEFFKDKLDQVQPSTLSSNNINATLVKTKSIQNIVPQNNTINQTKSTKNIQILPKKEEDNIQTTKINSKTLPAAKNLLKSAKLLKQPFLHKSNLKNFTFNTNRSKLTSNPF